MKKISLIAILMAAFFCLNSCDNQFNSTPEQDKTLLWPAQTDTCALWGYINEKGEMVIPAQYQNAYGFSCGKAKVVLKDGRDAFINREGKIVFTASEGEVCDDYFYYGCLRYGNNYDFFNDGNGYFYQCWAGMLNDHFKPIVSKGVYDNIEPMTKDGLAATSNGYINRHGRLVIPERNENGVLFNFCDGVAAILWKGKYGAINTKGKLVIDTIYDNFLSPVGENRLVYSEMRSGMWLCGLMDTKGRKITEPIFRGYAFFGDGGLMPIQRITDCGYSACYIDRNGEIQIQGPFSHSEPFYDGVAWVLDYKLSETKEQNIEYSYFKLINMQGETLFSLEKGQQPETVFHNGLCLIHDNNDNSYQYINKKGEVVYRWTPYKEKNNSPESHNPARLSEDELLLKHFEGTEYYPLAEQCVRRRQECENLKK
ncbi:MAG: WG repeat-containing protein [Paludibacteraceae bacterium]|nr:WG repeat-containing protein [Paludibacteraceae bacterium]